MDADSQTQSTGVTNGDAVEAVGVASSQSLQRVQSEETIELTRLTATNARKRARHQDGNVRKRVKHQGGVQRNAKVSRGHQFERTVAKGYARVHYCDYYNLGSCSHECLPLQQQNGRLHQRTNFEEAQVQGVVVTALVLKVLETFLNYILSVIPRAVRGRVTVLEDAFGRLWRIDIDTISTWQVSIDTCTRNYRNC